MPDINKEYIKTLSKIVEKIKRLQEQVIDVSNIEKNLSFRKLANSLEELRKNVDALKLITETELRTKTLKFETSLANLEEKIVDIVDGLKREIDTIKFLEEKDKELGYKIQKSLSETIKEIREELKNLKEELKKYVDELRFTKEGLLKSPGIVGPSASGIEVLLDNQKKGVYSKLNFLQGTNITFEFSETKPEGRANVKINSSGSTTDAIIYSIALG
jgi:DNA repair exonuclease SbcCD ATPase subunit